MRNLPLAPAVWMWILLVHISCLVLWLQNWLGGLVFGVSLSVRLSVCLSLSMILPSPRYSSIALIFRSWFQISPPLQSNSLWKEKRLSSRSGPTPGWLFHQSQSAERQPELAIVCHLDHCAPQVIRQSWIPSEWSHPQAMMREQFSLLCLSSRAGSLPWPHQQGAKHIPNTTLRAGNMTLQ